jgi:hypothetical protein
LAERELPPPLDVGKDGREDRGPVGLRADALPAVLVGAEA